MPEMTKNADADTGGELEATVDPSLLAASDDTALADELDALIAGKDPPAPVVGDRVEPAKAEPAAKVAPDATKTDEATDEPEVWRAIRAREQAQKIRDAAAEEAAALKEKMLADAKAEADRIKSATLAELQAERQKIADSFKADPLKAINDLGVDKRALVDGVVRSDDPVWQTQQQVAQLRAQIEQLTKQPAASSEFTEWRKAQEEQQAAQARARVEQEFVASAKTAVPDLYAQMEASAAALAAAGIAGAPSAEALLLQRGYQYAQEVEKALGRVASNAELVQYISHVERQRSGAAQGSAGKPPVGRVTGTRTLSGQAASERRTAPRSEAPSRDELAAEIDAMIAEDRHERKAGRR